MTMYIPGHTLAVREVAADLDRMITGSRWHRAAIVAAFVHVGSHGGDRTNPEDGLEGLLTPAAFAALGFAGLTSPETVRRYCRVWLHHFDRPTRGEYIEVPEIPFPSSVPAVGADEADAAIDVTGDDPSDDDVTDEAVRARVLSHRIVLAVTAAEVHIGEFPGAWMNDTTVADRIADALERVEGIDSITEGLTAADLVSLTTNPDPSTSSLRVEGGPLPSPGSAQRFL